MLYAILLKMMGSMPQILNVYTDLRNTQNALEEFVVDYVVEKEGSDSLEGSSEKAVNRIVDSTFVPTQTEKSGHYVLCKANKMTVKKLSIVNKSSWFGIVSQTEKTFSKVLSVQIMTLDYNQLETALVRTRKTQLPLEDIYKIRYAYGYAGHEDSEEARENLMYFLDSFEKLESTKYLKKHPKEAVSVSGLRNHFASEFVKCTHTEQKSAVLADLANTKTPHELLCESILKKRL